MAEDLIPDEDLVPDNDLVPDAPQPSLVEKAIEPITSYPATYSQMNKEAREQVGHGVEQLSKHESPWEVAKGAGNVALGSMGYVASPISAGLRTVVGKPVEEATGIPKEYTEFAAGLALPGIGLTRVPTKAPPPIPTTRGPLGVTLSKGQETGELPLIQREQSALRGQSGEPAQVAARDFAEQQKNQVEQARENISRAFDPYGAAIAETPQEAGAVASEAARSMEKATKKGVTGAYEYAKSLPGEIHAGAFEGIGQKIKGDLTLSHDPVIISELTPNASKMVDYLDKSVTQLKITNKADPYGPPGQVTGVTLKGVDQWRRVLSTFKNDAARNAGANATDARATKRVLDSFDNQVDDAISRGLFSGDQRAVQAWSDARAAHADYRSTFGKQAGSDRVGSVVQKVLGDRYNAPAGPNAVADYLYGSTGVNPTDLNRATAMRFKQILGGQSPQWSAVKQGLWSRMTEPGADLAAWGPKKAADKINKFLNIDGREMAQAVFSQPERQAMQSYADLLRKLEVPQSGANWSNTGTASVFKNIAQSLGGLIGMTIGHYAGHAIGAPPLLGEAAGLVLAPITKAVAENREAAKIAQQMPILSNQMQLWSRAYAKNQIAPTSHTQRMLTGASVSLDSTLRKLGTSFEEMSHGTVPAAAEPEQNKRDGGRTNKPNRSAKNEPPVHGARRAPDGKWYLADKTRPGRFLRVET